jgi:hypothetical protein
MTTGPGPDSFEGARLNSLGSDSVSSPTPGHGNCSVSASRSSLFCRDLRNDIVASTTITMRAIALPIPTTLPKSGLFSKKGTGAGPVEAAEDVGEVEVTTLAADEATSTTWVRVIT